MFLLQLSAIVGLAAACLFGAVAFLARKEIKKTQGELSEARQRIEELQNERLKSMEEKSAAVENAGNAQKQLLVLTEKFSVLENTSKQNSDARLLAEAEAAKYRELLEKERQLLLQTEEKFQAAFKNLASTALEKNNEQFLVLAKQIFSKYTETAKGDLAQKEQSIENMVKPLKETIDRYQIHLRELENSRQKSYANVEAELKRVIETSSSLSSETRALKDALKKPHVRGRWGEIQLRNCVELAGMSEFADFTLQDANSTDEGIFIPDMTVKMPGGRLVVVDSKAPMDAFVTSLEATSDEQRGAELARHGRQVKEHIKKLSAKSYQDKIAGSADFTVMFLPNESFLYAALESEPDLVGFAMERKILIATPPTFVGLLKVIRFGWNEERLAQNAAEISEAGKELHKRVADFVESFEKIGTHLTKAREEFETGRMRLSSKVLVQARRMEALGVKSKKELPEDLGHETDAEELRVLESGSSPTLLVG